MLCMRSICGKPHSWVQRLKSHPSNACPYLVHTSSGIMWSIAQCWLKRTPEIVHNLSSILIHSSINPLRVGGRYWLDLATLSTWQTHRAFTRWTHLVNHSPVPQPLPGIVSLVANSQPNLNPKCWDSCHPKELHLVPSTMRLRPYSMIKLYLRGLLRKYDNTVAVRLLWPFIINNSCSTPHISIKRKLLLN